MTAIIRTALTLKWLKVYCGHAAATAAMTAGQEKTTQTIQEEGLQ